MRTSAAPAGERPLWLEQVAAYVQRAVKVGNRNRIPFEEFERFWRQTMGDMVELVRDDIVADLFGDAR